MTTERQFIRDLQAQFGTVPPVKIGIGDDGAVLDVSGDSEQVVVTDLLLDGVHFDLNVTSPFLVGRKAVAVNLSDLAAMGCRPTAAFVSLAIPRGRPQAATDFLCELYRGIQQMTDEFQFSLAGGDTNSWNGPFAINVCLTGVPFSRRPFLRSDAQPETQFCDWSPWWKSRWWSSSYFYAATADFSMARADGGSAGDAGSFRWIVN